MKSSQTKQAYTELDRAYTHFNHHLFGGRLPGAIITLARRARTRGYYISKAFADARHEHADEIALNPQHLKSRPIDQALSTLAHEMVHQWQEHFGKPSRRAYHNKEWANKMEEVGLMPSSTGEPGGKRVGEKMTHYIIENGDFALATKALLDESYTITWGDAFIEEDAEAQDDDENKSNRVKYSCACCSVWGKADLELHCNACGEDFEAH